MTMNEMRKLAKTLNIEQPDRLTKIDLIRAIQRAEGNLDCYASLRRIDCPESDCLWEKECKKER